MTTSWTLPDNPKLEEFVALAGQLGPRASQAFSAATSLEELEQARIDWLRRMDLQTTKQGEGPVVAQTSCNYRKAIPWVNAIDVRVYAGPAGRSSFPTYYEIASAEDADTLYADGQAIMVWTDRSSGKSRPVPDRLRALLA